MLDISGILDDVVHQFAEPLAFYRELVQNAVDAGTGEVDVDLVWDSGLATATVRDFGGGMTREIIQTQLCRLFSSAKHGDLTKIGRFGIGFVSVYGVEPDVVSVDTGRDGDSWRVLFLDDRTWELYALRHPVEGTTVSVHKSMTEEEFEAFRTRSRDVVTKWCRHVQVPVRFDGDDVRAPFEIVSPCAVEFEEQGTRLVAGIVAEPSPTCGFYNRGLMLKETAGSPWPHLQFKIDSRYLEHTLTRDDVMQDANFAKARALLDRFASHELPAKLLTDLREAARSEELTRSRELIELLDGLARSAARTVEGWRRLPLIPAVSGPTSPAACDDAAEKKRLWWSASDSALARKVSNLGATVVLGDREVLERLLSVRLRDVHQVFVELHARPWSTSPRAAEMVPWLLELLESRGAAPERVWVGRWSGPEIATTTDDPELPVARAALARPTSDGSKQFVLNAGHSLVDAALSLAEIDPRLAAVTIAAAQYPHAAEELAMQMHRGRS